MKITSEDLRLLKDLNFDLTTHLRSGGMYDCLTIENAFLLTLICELELQEKKEKKKLRARIKAHFNK